MARKTAVTTVKFLLPGAAGMAIQIDEPEQFGGQTAYGYDVRGARFGVSYIVEASIPAAKAILAKTEIHAHPKGVGQPSSWGHACRKAVPRIRKALAAAK